MAARAEHAELIKGLALEQVLGRGAHSVVWSASRSGDLTTAFDTRSLVVKLALDGAPEHGAMLRHEARFLARLDSPCIPTLYAAGTTADGREYLLLSGTSLGTLADRLRHGPLAVDQTLRIARDLCDALAEAHARGVVHRDVKPSNVLLDEGGPWARLTDFGIAEDLALLDAGALSARIAGSFAYSAPEQTGMLWRGVDGRADLYALGCVIFECLVGHPPFQGDEAEVLLQLHATARAPDVRALRPEVPDALARIVDKLLNKDPDDRYPNAHCLAADLERVARGERLKALALAQRHAEAPLPGRDAELSELRLAISSLSSGRGQALWVQGEPGSGRAALCRTALARSPHTLVLWSTAREQDGTSFSASQTLLRQLMQQAHDDRELTTRLREALAREGPLLARLFPELSGLPAPARDIDLEGAVEALARTFAGSATRERPLVLVFEEADRLVAAELSLVQRLLDHSRDAALLVLCTASQKAPLDGQPNLRTLPLEPLDREGIEKVLRHTLGPRPLPPRLSELALQCTGGNPRRLAQHIALALHEEALNTDGHHWTLDEPRFVGLEVKGVTTASAQAALSRLSEAELAPLRIAALLGRRFHSHWLERVGFEKAHIDRVLWEAVQLRLVVSADDGTVTFVGTALVDALRESLPAAEVTRVYGAIAATLSERHSHDARERALVARAAFFASTAETAAESFDFCLAAGLSSLEAFNFDEAETLLGYAETLSNRFGLPDDFRLMRALGQLDAQRSDVEAAVMALNRAILACPHAPTRAAMHARCAELHFFNEMGHTGPMRQHLEQGFRDLGRPLPPSGWWALVLALFHAARAFFMELTGVGLGVDRHKPEAHTHIRMIELTGMYYFWMQNMLATLNVGMYGWMLGRRVGPSRELGSGLAALANFFYIIKHRRRAEAYYDEVYAMADTLEDPRIRAHARYLQGVGLSLYGDIDAGERILAQTLDKHIGDLDIAYISQGFTNLASSYMIRGYVHRTAALLDRITGIVQARLGREAELPESCLVAQLDVLSSLDRVDLCEPVMERLARRLSAPEEDPLGWLMRWHSVAFYRAIQGADDEAIDEAVARAHRSRLTPKHAAWLMARGYVTVAHIRLFQMFRASPERLAERRRIFIESARWARTCPRGPYMNGHLHVLHAAELWCLGDQKAAERALIEAEREATQHDFPAVLVEARALRARILLSLGRDDAARSEGRAAVAVADSIGQLRRAREIERALGLTHTRVTQSASVPTSARAVLAQHTAQRERDVLLQVTLAASRELEPEAQARAVLDRLIGLLGAERGLIFADYGAGALRAVAARSASREDLEPSQTYAKSLVRRVRASGVPIVMSGTEEGASLGSESVVAANLRSMVCAPIRLADQILGVIYLDSSLARGVFTRGDLEILEAIGGQIALSQEMARAARLEIERREIDKDLQLSGAVQSLLLPSSRELSKGPVRLSAAYSPASHSGGDFWSYEVLADGRIWVLLADATGHGAGAAMVTALLAGSYRTLIDAGAHDLRRFVEALNRSLTHLCAGRHAATLTALELDPSGQRMRTLCAGAPPVLVCRPGAPAEPIVLRGTPLGSEPFALGEQTVALTPGTRVLTVTDGVLEMPTVDGRELGARRLSRLLEKHAATEVPLARDQIMNELRLASQGCPVEDDLTLLLLGIAER